jgi:hypothetical protein
MVEIASDCYETHKYEHLFLAPLFYYWVNYTTALLKSTFRDQWLANENKASNKKSRRLRWLTKLGSRIMNKLSIARNQDLRKKKIREEFLKDYIAKPDKICVKNATSPPTNFASKKQGWMPWQKGDYSGNTEDQKKIRLVLNMFDHNVVKCMEEFEGANLTSPAKGPSSLLSDGETTFSLKLNWIGNQCYDKFYTGKPHKTLSEKFHGVKVKDFTGSHCYTYAMQLSRKITDFRTIGDWVELSGAFAQVTNFIVGTIGDQNSKDKWGAYMRSTCIPKGTQISYDLKHTMARKQNASLTGNFFRLNFQWRQAS